MAVAAAMVGTAGLLIEQGRITGRGPLHPATRAAWKAAGNEPYTILAGDGTKIHYNRLSSLFGPLAIISDAYMASGSMKNAEEVSVGLMQVTASLLNYVSDQGFVGNAGDMFDTLMGGEGSKITDFVQRVSLNMVVPKAISQFTALDDNMREADSYVEELMKLTPGLSETLPPARNIFREPIFKAPGSFDRLLNPFTSMGKQNTQVAMALFRVGKNMTLPGDKKFGGRIELKDTDRWGEVNGMSPYEYWLEKTAKPDDVSMTLKEELADLVLSQDWRDMPVGSEDWPGGPRYEAAAMIVQIAQDIAWQETLVAFPDLQDAVIDETVLKSLGRFGGKDATDAFLEDLESQ